MQKKQQQTNNKNNVAIRFWFRIDYGIPIMSQDVVLYLILK
jgi:hypothetical protein